MHTVGMTFLSTLDSLQIWLKINITFYCLLC
jgi:hypothetical protein